MILSKYLQSSELLSLWTLFFIQKVRGHKSITGPHLWNVIELYHRESESFFFFESWWISWAVMSKTGNYLKQENKTVPSHCFSVKFKIQNIIRKNYTFLFIYLLFQRSMAVRAHKGWIHRTCVLFVCWSGLTTMNASLIRPSKDSKLLM